MNLDFGSFNSLILSSALFILIQPLNKINQKRHRCIWWDEKARTRTRFTMTTLLLAISPWDDGRLTKLLWRLYYYHYLILSYLILSFLFLSCLTLFDFISSYLTLSYLILSYFIWSYLIGNFLLRWWEADKAFVKTFLSDPNLAPRLKAQCCKCLFISLTSLCLFNPLQHGFSNEI